MTKKNQRTNNVSLKLTDNEKERITLFAEQRDLSIAEYVRMSALKHKIKPTVVEIKKEEIERVNAEGRYEITQKELDAIDELINLFDETGYMHLNKFNSDKQKYINIRRAFKDLINKEKGKQVD